MASEANRTHIPGEAGVWILLFGEMTFFSALFTAFLYYRNMDVATFAASQVELSKTIGVFNTLLLLTSSLFVALGVRATAQAQSNLAPKLFLAGLCCGLGFIALKGIEYHELFGRGIAVTTNTFFGFYFGLTILHLGHVVIGAGLLTVLSRVTRTLPAQPAHFALMESAGCFWHMVDLLWIIIFALLYLVE
jgi:nitric oxide reductase NorE protein